MNLFILAAALVLFDAASDGSGRTSAAIHYSSYDRHGDSLSVTLSTGDPYFVDPWHHWCPTRYYVTRPVYYVYEPYYTYDPYHQCHHYDPVYDGYYVDDGYVVYDDDRYYDDGPYYGWYEAPRYCDPLIVVQNNYYVDKRKPKKHWDDERYDWDRYDRDWSRDGRDVLLASVEPRRQQDTYKVDRDFRLKERAVIDRDRTVRSDRTLVATNSRARKTDFDLASRNTDRRVATSRARIERVPDSKDRGFTRQTQRVNPQTARKSESRSVVQRDTRRVSPQTVRKSESRAVVQRDARRVSPQTARKSEPKGQTLERRSQRVRQETVRKPDQRTRTSAQRDTRSVSPIQRQKQRADQRSVRKSDPRAQAVQRTSAPRTQGKSRDAGKPGPRSNDRTKKGRG